jgi:purine-binding chemotaxis protein CheW
VTSSPSDDFARVAGQEYLTFFIAGEEYAVSLEFVREVIPYDTVTRVPGMPDTVRGVTNLRGSVVPVVDLALKFRLPEVPITARTCIVLVETTLDGAPVLMGLMTEQVGQVLGLAPGELLPAPSFGAPVRTDFLLGMAPLGKKFALVLDIRRVLSPKELLVDEPELALAFAPSAAEAPQAEPAQAVPPQAEPPQAPPLQAEQGA